MIIQWTVTASPKRKYADIYATFWVIVNAETKAGAIRLAESLDGWSAKFDPKYFTKTTAVPMVIGKVFRT